MGPDPRNTNLITNHSTTTTTPNNMSRALKIGGGVVAVGAGYYFYRAGGDATAAKKRFEADATKVKHIGKEDISGKGTEIRKDAEVFAADAGKEIDRLLLRLAMAHTRSTRNSRHTGKG